MKTPLPQKAVLVMLQITLALLLASCKDGLPDWEITVNNAEFDINTDGELPPDVTDLVIDLAGIEFQPSDGESFVVPLDDAQINLIKINPEIIKTLFDFLLPAGHYDWIRLIPNAESGTIDSYVQQADGSQWSIFIDPSSLGSLIFSQPFTINDSGELQGFTLNFDLQDALQPPDGDSPDYLFTPETTLIINDEAGKLTGVVDSVLVTSDSCAIYLYEGGDATVGERGSSSPPSRRVEILYDEETDNYYYLLELMIAGDYTLAYTCQANIDTTSAIEDINISNGTHVSVSDNHTTILNFFLGTSS